MQLLGGLGWRLTSCSRVELNLLKFSWWWVGRQNVGSRQEVKGSRKQICCRPVAICQFFLQLPAVTYYLLLTTYLLPTQLLPRTDLLPTYHGSVGVVRLLGMHEQILTSATCTIQLRQTRVIPQHHLAKCFELQKGLQLPVVHSRMMAQNIMCFPTSSLLSQRMCLTSVEGKRIKTIIFVYTNVFQHLCILCLENILCT